MRARQRPGVMNGVELERGQLVYGEEEIGVACGLTRHRVRTLLDRLVKLGELAIKADNHGSTATVVRYGVYVADDAAAGQHSGQQVASKRPASGHKQKVKEEDTSNRIEDSGRPRDGFMDEMQTLWTECWPQFGDPPFSLFGKWRQEYGGDAVLAMAKKVGLSGKDFDREDGLRAYLNAALANEDDARQSAQEMPLVIATALGEPITDPDERLARIRELGCDADPDQGQWFTIPEIVVRAGMMDAETRDVILGRSPNEEGHSEGEARS